MSTYICSTCNIEKESQQFMFRDKICKNCEDCRIKNRTKVQICRTCKISLPITEFIKGQRLFVNCPDCRKRNTDRKKRYGEKSETATNYDEDNSEILKEIGEPEQEQKLNYTMSRWCAEEPASELLSTEIQSESDKIDDINLDDIIEVLYGIIDELKKKTARN